MEKEVEKELKKDKKQKVLVEVGVRQLIEDDMCISEDFLPALENKIKKLISDASERAKGNGRKTIMERDV